ncbi:ferredoxin family protein [Thermodesulfobacteriota bacterium]
MPPIINPEKCNACGKCVDICEGDVFYGSKKGEIPEINYPEECWHDANCVKFCPVEGAIRIRIPLPMMISYKP